MSSATFLRFQLLPLELRSLIWQQSMPVTTTVHIREGADLEVTSVSSPPGQATANKEARQAYLSRGFRTFGIMTTVGYEDIHINEDTTIQLVIEPSEKPKATLNITWTELEVLLYKALPAVKSLHIMCSKPERLVRLWITPEGGLINPGQDHTGGNLWPADTLASDRNYRETLNHSLQVTTSVSTLEALARGSAEEVTRWELVEEKILVGFGLEAEISTTKAFKLVGEEEEDPRVELWEELGNRESEELRGAGCELTEDAIEKFLQQTEWKPKPLVLSRTYSGGICYRDGAWLTLE